MIENFSSNYVQIGSKSANKEALLQEIADMASKAPELKSIKTDQIFDALKKREELHSTGLADGIAIPHCSFDDIENFVVGLVVLKDGIDFQAMDKKPSKLVFFIIGPSAERNKHIKILSSISKISKEPGLVKKLISAENPEGAADLLQPKQEEQVGFQEITKCQIVIHVQHEDMFIDLLETLSSEVEGSVSVIDSAPAGSYLHKLPLFSTFWNETSSYFGKIVVAIIDKRFLNDTIRRINLLKKDSGMLVTVTDLIYVDGAIDF